MNIEIGQAWIVFEPNNEDFHWEVMIVNKFFNYKNEIRWLAIKLIPKKNKQDIVNHSAFFVFDNDGKYVCDQTDDKFYLAWKFPGKRFKHIINGKSNVST